jgi:hypothetical protein
MKRKEITPGEHAQKLGEELADLIVKRAKEVVDKGGPANDLLLFCSITVDYIVEKLDERQLGNPGDFTIAEMIVMTAKLKDRLADALGDDACFSEKERAIIQRLGAAS